MRFLPVYPLGVPENRPLSALRISLLALWVLRWQAEVLKTERNIDLRVVAVASSGKMLLSNE